MEKEGAEKATTESENSVTSKEDNSLAEKNEDNVALAEAEVESSPVEDLSADKEIKAENATDESELKEEDTSSEDSVESKSKSDHTTSKGADSEETQSNQEPQNSEAGSAQATAENIDPETNEPSEVREDKAPASGEKDTPRDEKEESKEGESSSPDDRAKEIDKEEEKKDEYQDIDFTKFSKEELVGVIKNLGKEDNPFSADRILKQIAPLFNKIRDDERADALKKFINEGGVEDDFQFRPDELSLQFDANYRLIKDKKSRKFKEQDLERAKNLILAEDVLNELRDFVDSEESSSSFNAFKVIQQKWKDLGDVPSQNSRTLWANYNALVHRFYDQRSIYFELKELDRKKNYEVKLVLCDKAEALVDVKNLREAIKSLNDLHHEFKHLGPVPQEVQEELWQRFKSASDKVYERRKAFVHELKAELHENLAKKLELIEKIKLISEFQSDGIKLWNEKTKELIGLQKAWEAIGGLPKDKAKHINKEFWSSFKKFFSNKHMFFKKLDADRDEHLIKKQALLEQALALKDSKEWEKTANELKKLQSDWREIGPVPEKMRKKLYDEFKACCDHFFEQRRVGLKSSQDDYKVNLRSKKNIIGQLIKLKDEADKNLDKFNELRKEFLEMGFVPKKNITSIKEDYQQAVEAFLHNLTVLNVKEKTEISLEAEFTSLAGSEHSESDLYHKEQSVRRQINKLEDDIALWQNNLEFFAHSKSTDKLREEVNSKIDVAGTHMESLKRQLKMLRSL
jgi:Domain of Unknown Function (DUF349)